MMSQDNISANQDNKDENQGSVGRKTGPARPLEQSLKCPRCDSPNTKFCYYNNYSLTQPRHFCKTCRRYWTKGGALRNVPIGGGCRKNKKVRSSSSSRLSGDSRDTSGSSEMGVGGLNLKFFHGISPAMDFQLGGLSMSSSSFPRLHHHASTSGIYNNNNQFSFGDHVISATSGPSLNLDPYTFPPLSSSAAAAGGFSAAIQEMGAMNVHGSLASSIESLSSINQDLHWKLQQQRLAMLFGEESQKDSSVSSVPIETQIQKPQPILFQNLEISKPDVVCSGVNNNSRKEGASCDHHQPSTEWFFGNSYAPVTATSNLNNSSSNGNNDITSNWNGVQSWGTTSADLHHQFSALP